MSRPRLALLTEGKLNRNDAKTAVGMLRYRPQDVCAVLDSTRAGEDLEALVGAGAGIPIVASAEEALRLNPTALLIGIAVTGGMLPDEWRDLVRSFLDQGRDIINGLHTMIGDDPEFADLATRTGARIRDLRRPPRDLTCSAARARQHRGVRILTVGTDANLGKKTTALEVTAAAQADGVDAHFIATGQTGILIAGDGIAVDAVPADFVGGAVERMILQHADHYLLLIEGQGAITHPGFSAVTLGLLHGAVPQGLILCHEPQRLSMRGPEQPLPSLREARSLYESLARPVGPCRTVAVSLNTAGLSDAEAAGAVRAAEDELQLPAADPIRHGSQVLWEAVRKLAAEMAPVS